MSSPAEVSSGTLRMAVAPGNVGARFVEVPCTITGASSTGVTSMVTSMEAEAPKESSAMTVTM